MVPVAIRDWLGLEITNQKTLKGDLYFLTWVLEEC